MNKSAIASVCLCAALVCSVSPAGSAVELIENIDLEGGLIVHVGCGDGSLTASLCSDDNFVVQGLDRSVSNVAAARRQLLAKGLYGRVSVLDWHGEALPYNDNLVNVLVVESPDDVSEEEMLRVLVPRGTAFVKRGADWRKLVKPVSGELDDWTHSLYDSTGNAVSRDRIVAPSKHLQWFSGPRFGRQHEHMSSFVALVSYQGRIFYIVDEGSPVSIMFPSKWKLIARDAYNSSPLWERPIDRWHSRYWPMKNGPVALPRRLVAVDGSVYVTLGIDAPISQLDAASGETTRQYDETAGTYEFVVSDGDIFAAVNPSGEYFKHQRKLEDMVAERNMIFEQSLPKDPLDVTAIRAATGEVLWKVRSQVTQSSLAVDARYVAFHDDEGVVCLDRANGKRLWKTPVEQESQYQFGRGATLVLAGDVIVFSGQIGSTTALDAQSGEILWTAPQPNTGHHSPYDVFVIDNQVWYGQTASGRPPGKFVGINLHTGEIEQSFEMDKEPHWFHHRCHRARATENYLITSRTGVEFIDFRKAEWDVNHWVRGACTYGIMPANGLLYAPPHPCACYLSTKLSYFNALTPTSRITYREKPQAAPERLERGDAYSSSVTNPQSPTPNPSSGEWPLYRHDVGRSGATTQQVAADLDPAWSTALGGKLTSCTVAGSKVFVAAADRHTVHALDAQDGSRQWQFTTGGRIDSPPAFVAGRVVFGSCDGSVYCLRATDGQLLWRYRAAPQRRQMMALGQLESPWPVHGSVFVQDDTAYCIAGRSRFLDGGMRLVMLDVETGKLRGEKTLDQYDMTTKEDLHTQVKGLSMPTGLPDILSGNGKYVFMHSQVFDLEGKTLDPASFEGREGEIRYLFTPTGFLDSSWFHRTYWLYGTQFHSGWNQWYKAGRAVPAGRILVHADNSVFGFGRVQGDYRWVTPLGYHLFRIDKEPELLGPEQKEAGYGHPTPNQFKYQWSRSVPLLVKAMLLADDTLFIAGPPNTLDEKEEWKQIYDAETQAKLARQAEVLEGVDGSLLWAVSAKSGEKLSERRVDSLPVWDGMAAAYGKLYVPMQDGSVLCFGK